MVCYLAQQGCHTSCQVELSYSYLDLMQTVMLAHLLEIVVIALDFEVLLEHFLADSRIDSQKGIDYHQTCARYYLKDLDWVDQFQRQAFF